jgi:hypothetical protein
MNPKAAMTALGLIVGAVPVAGNANTFTTVDVSSYLDNNQSITRRAFGTTTGNQGTGIPFAITPNSSEQTSWLASNSSSGVLDISVNVPGSNDPALFTGLTFSGQPAVVFGAVPEPSTWAMIILGFMAYRRKQNGTALRLA